MNLIKGFYQYLYCIFINKKGSHVDSPYLNICIDRMKNGKNILNFIKMHP